MKFIHLSDLHIGKQVNGKSMYDEQRFILKKILGLVQSHKPDAVFIAGDIYDKSVPSAEAVQLCDEFLSDLSNVLPNNAKLFVSSGNHDSAERIAFGSAIMSRCGVYVSPVFQGEVSPVVMHDEFGEVAVYMLPFVKPAQVRHCFPEEQIESYTDCVRVAIEKMKVDKTRRNVILSHQFVTGAERSDSEETSVGGVDNVDVSVYDDFDYVALGHLHRPQSCVRETVRYSGSPLKYSFSEVNNEKSVTIVELGAKGDVKLSFEPLIPLHDWHDIRGAYDEVTAKSFYDGTNLQEDFVRITLIDEDDIPDAIGKLRTIYHNLLELRYDNKRTRSVGSCLQNTQVVESKTPGELFSEFFEQQYRQPLTEEQTSFVEGLIEQIWEE